MAHILLDTAVYPLYWVRSKNTLKQGQFLEISNVAATCKLMVKENLERSWKKSWKVMESHGIWRAQKNTNPVNYMCSVVLIITGKDLPIPHSRVQNVSCWNGNSEDVCLRVLKESNKSRFDSYNVRNSVLIISHNFITFRDCSVHIFSDNLSWNSCMSL